MNMQTEGVQLDSKSVQAALSEKKPPPKEEPKKETKCQEVQADIKEETKLPPLTVNRSQQFEQVVYSDKNIQMQVSFREAELQTDAVTIAPA